ncbi:hypothetical protein ABVK25_003375 [Lepraria finkii]|uniref:Uncharacterized protein n=1 Tax=Lepraria finkii TaxID=1340010 RepID=A0ABR4BES7_9LECA
MSFCKFKNVHCTAIFFLLVWSVFVSSCSGFVNWIYPGVETSGLTFNYIDTVYFTWTSSIADPYMNLWCAPSNTSAQSKTYVYHSETSTNGTSPQSFPYSEYYNNGVCHMQLEDFSGDDFANTPTFDITSNDAVAPQTWGLSATSLLDRGSNPTTIASSSSTGVSSTVVATALSSSSSLSPASFSSSSSLLLLLLLLLLFNKGITYDSSCNNDDKGSSATDIPIIAL